MIEYTILVREGCTLTKFMIESTILVRKKGVPYHCTLKVLNNFLPKYYNINSLLKFSKVVRQKAENAF